MNGTCFLNSLCEHIGETVTIFTASGGISGNGFTGILASVNETNIRLITDFGGAPTCPVGSNCSCRRMNNYNYSNCGNNLGSVTIIPIDKIVSFTHNAI